MALSLKIHLVRSNEVTSERLRALVNLLEQYPGPAKFVQAEKSLALHLDIEDEFLSWPLIWWNCDKFRSENHILPEEAVVILTDLSIDGNWFSSGLVDEKRNFFVRTDEEDWKNYVEAPWIYPAASELASIELAMGGFKNLKEIEDMAHREKPRGCIFDFCGDKHDIRLRLRTADICLECRNKLEELEVDPPLLFQVFAIMEGVRSQMLFRERMEILEIYSRMIVDQDKHYLYFPDLGNISVKLDAQKMMVYHFFLNHKEGISFSDLRYYKNELYELYLKYSNTINLAKLENEFVKLLNPGEKEKIEEKGKRIKHSVDRILEQEPFPKLSSIISKINKLLKANIDSKIVKDYCINESDELHIIKIDRDYVKFQDRNHKPFIQLRKVIITPRKF